jgi:transposase
MKFVATKTAEQLDLQALHRVCVSGWSSQRTGIINQIRAFLLERGIAVRQGLRFLRAELLRILATPCDALSPRLLRVIEDLAADWRRLDERIEGISSEIEGLARQDSLTRLADRSQLRTPGRSPGFSFREHSLSLDSWLRRFLLGALQFANQPTCATRF